LITVECTFWNFNLATQQPFPRCLWWMFDDFLFEIENELRQTAPVPQDNYFARRLSLVKRLPRISWLIYWFATMLVTIPLAPTTGRISPVIARKWFHFIAVLLFVPTTVLVPQLQSLSYAVAICVLLIVEVVRIDIPILNDFYYMYLDHTKDDADDRKFVISHIALVAGCATPLWIIQYIKFSVFRENIDLSALDALDALVGLCGVWVLGLGDAMGAIIGKSIGRNKWGSNARTMEGSMAMLVCLCLSCFATSVFTVWTTIPVYTVLGLLYSVALWFPAVLFVTLIEAFTIQIDNIVLPLAGTAMILVCQKWIMNNR
jgi:dolichol kinase